MWKKLVFGIILAQIFIMVFTMSKSFADEQTPLGDEEFGDYVVILKVFGCSSGQEENASRKLTGFFSLGKKGIITALHGIVGCLKEEPGTGLCVHVSITEAFVQEDNEEDFANRRSETYDCLRIEEIYIAGDIVHLYSPSLGKDRGPIWPEDGLQAADSTPRNPWTCKGGYSEDVLVFGFPKNSNYISKRKVPVVCVRVLREFIPIDYLKYLDERKSPDLMKKILNLQGQLEPGDSGAPVIRLVDNTLMGVVLGGIPNESYAVWAYPWSEEMAWTTGSEARKDLLRINSLTLPETSDSSLRPLDTLFGFVPNYEESVKPSTEDRFPYISVSNQDVKIGIGPGEISTNVYTPKDACIVILTDDFYAEKPTEIAKIDISATESLKPHFVPIVRVPTTPVSAYKEFCIEAANNTRVTLYAYLYERVGGVCNLPLPTKYDLAYDKFELRTVEDFWSAAFCADTDLRNFSNH